MVTKIYDRSVFFDPDIVFPENIFYEDNAVFADIAMRIRRFEYIPEPLYFYYQHSESTTHHVTMGNILDRLTSKRIMLEHSKLNGAAEEFPDVVEFHFAKLFYQNTLFSYMQSDIKKDPTFLKMLAGEIIKEYPDFRNNTYFKASINDYELKLVNLHLDNISKFLFIYKLKQIPKKIKSL